MSQPPSESRRGAALLIVLATLILAVTASATLARLASTAKVERIVAHRSVVADDLLGAVEAPILQWLAVKSASVVLAPESAIPQVDVLHDYWIAEGTVYELHISGWDQCGMVPINVARSGSPLRLGLPAQVSRVLDRATLPEDQPLGLDLFSCPRQTDQRIGVFPTHGSSQPMIFGPRRDGEPLAQSRSSSEEQAGAPITPAVGEFVATHNPGRINVNTAPMVLVKAALRLAGRGGIEQIFAARSEGQRTTVGGLPTNAPPGVGGRAAPQIAATSNAWAFRIDIRIGSLQRSWWAVYVKSRSEWECVQRLAIPD